MHHRLTIQKYPLSRNLKLRLSEEVCLSLTTHTYQLIRPNEEGWKGTFDRLLISSRKLNNAVKLPHLFPVRL